MQERQRERYWAESENRERENGSEKHRANELERERDSKRTQMSKIGRVGELNKG